MSSIHVINKLTIDFPNIVYFVDSNHYSLVFWSKEGSVTVVKEMHIVKPYRPDVEEKIEVKSGGQLYAGVLKCFGTCAVVSKAEEEFISTMKQTTPSCMQIEGSKQKKATDGRARIRRQTVVTI